MSEAAATTAMVDLTVERSIYRRIAIRLLPFLTLCYLLSYIDRINIGFARLQMEHDLGWNAAIYGLGAGLFFVGYIIFEIPSNYILTRVGAKFWIARIMITWGILSGMTSLVTEPWHFYSLRFLLGFAEAGFLPGVLYYLTMWFPSARRGRIIALFMAGLPIANMIGAPISGWILKNFNGYHGLNGWQWLFVVEAIPTVLVGFATIVVIPNSLHDAKWLSASDRNYVSSQLLLEQRGESHGETFLDALKSLRIWSLGAVDFSILLTSYAIGFWLPSFLRDAGVSDTVEIGFWTAISSLAGLCGILIGGFSADHFRERRWHIIGPFIVAAASLIGTILVARNVAATVSLFAIANFCVLGAVPALFSLPGFFFKDSAAAAAFALIISIASTAGFVSNVLTGYMIVLTGGPGGALAFFAACLLASCIIVYFIPAHVVNK